MSYHRWIDNDLRSGATHAMMRGYFSTGGEIRVVVGSHVIASGGYGQEVRTNMIHKKGQWIKWYVNEVLKLTKSDNDPTATHYWKYGVYGFTNGNVPAKSVWRNVKTFKNGNEPIGNTGPVVLYQYCSYGGSGGSDVGNARMSNLIAHGIQNDDVSSLKIQNDYTITLHQHDNYRCNSIILPSDNSCLLDEGFNNDISSIQITNSSCTSNTIILYLWVNSSSWQKTFTASVTAGGLVKFGPRLTRGDSWSGSVPNGFNTSSNEVTISNTQTNRAGNPIATYTNTRGCFSSQNFPITVQSANTGSCNGAPQYTEGGGYSDGDQVQNGGNLYECEPYTYEGWCNGAAWAHASGSDDFWPSAWISVGSCASVRSSNSTKDELEVFKGILIIPNRAKDHFQLTDIHENVTVMITDQCKDTNGYRKIDHS